LNADLLLYIGSNIIFGAGNVFLEYYWRKPAESGRSFIKYQRQIGAGSFFLINSMVGRMPKDAILQNVKSSETVRTDM